MCVDVVKFLRDWSIPGFICTGIFAIVALFAPYYNAQRLRKRNAPKLDIEFDEKIYCRHTQTGKKEEPYFCHFAVVNNGVNQADDCEAVLEKIWDDVHGEKDHLKWPERESWIPVNLKWSAERKGSEKACFKTIYPGGKRYFCDIAFVNSKEGKKFTFELPRTFISQDTFLKPGSHKIQISVYSKNAAKATEKFEIDWCGEWKGTQPEMQERLKIKML